MSAATVDESNLCDNLRMDENKLKSVYFIYSQHQLLLKEAVKRLAAAVGADSQDALDVVHLHAREDDPERILTECQTLSFLGDRRLIIVDDPLSLRADGQKKFGPYLDNPNPQSVLVLSQEIEKGQAKKRLTGSALFKLCGACKEATVAEYEIKSGVGSWIKAAFAERNKAPSQDSVKYLLRWVGTDLDRLGSEIAKLCDAAGDAGEIDLELCRRVVVTAGEAEVFDYIGAVIDRDQEKALTMLEPLLDRESVVGNTFALLERQFQLILQTRIEQLRGQALAKVIGVSSGQAYYLEKQSRLFSPGALEQALSLLVEADYARKSRPTPTRILLEQLTVDLCGLS